jgi:hypothetical protein
LKLLDRGFAKNSLCPLQFIDFKSLTEMTEPRGLLEAFRDVTLTVIETVDQTYRHLKALSPLQERILDLLGFSSRVYRRFCTVSHEPL